MKTLGCLVVIIVVCLGIFWLSSSSELSEKGKAQLAGQKVHRGWNQVRDYARNFKKGWKSIDDKTNKDKTP